MASSMALSVNRLVFVDIKIPPVFATGNKRSAEDGRCFYLRLQIIKKSHCNPSRCNAIQEVYLWASFPPTVLTVSGSRVKARKPPLSRSHPAPRRRYYNVLTSLYIIVEKCQSKLSFSTPTNNINCRGGSWPSRRKTICIFPIFNIINIILPSAIVILLRQNHREGQDPPLQCMIG